MGSSPDHHSPHPKPADGLKELPSPLKRHEGKVRGGKQRTVGRQGFVSPGITLLPLLLSSQSVTLSSVCDERCSFFFFK